ncbi:hypothetical protein GSI_03705 [Ganoderma sinense ZZ0214-1]|uniref:Uncharacterized protein n=1 Tax=Ganoderma sinense ZZ0214-1 TaxID=1077348 RepID=A0A2G8SJT2_9APHY|nr:hypothetical protein GSI_03705 [Ganoderma sinense ZZ0214-1]
MDHLISKLQAQARAHSSHPILRRILPEFLYLLNGVQPDSPDVKRRYDELHRDLGMLATEGYWNPSKQDEDALRALKRKLGLLQDDTSDSPRPDAPVDDTPPKPTRRTSSQDMKSDASEPTIHPPTLSTPLLPVSTASPTVLPIELVQILNQTFFLHLLATDPQRVLPPGKSLLSMMSTPRSNSLVSDESQAKLEERVKDMVYSAFWKEAFESLSSSSADKQLPRIRRLYEDLLAALRPLLPKKHPILVTLSLPLSPTSAPLRSVAMHLREILVALRARASPARDTHIDTLLRTLDELNQSALPEDLARLVVNTTRSILELADIMKEDLSQFVLGSMEERELKAVITQQAMLREKALVLQLWPPSSVEPTWRTWLDELDVSAFPDAGAVQPTSRRWVYRLVQALGTNFAVACPLPTTRIPGTDTPGLPEPEPEFGEAPPNTLPPPFFVTTPALLTAQNHLQALVIAASLRSLVRLPSRLALASASASAAGRSSDFMERIWTLLKASTDEEPGAEGTKIVNLADEVVRVRRACADDSGSGGPDLDPEEEARLRAAVDRTLQPRDPVFVLLQRRLLRGLATWLTLVSAAETATASRPVHMHMQTGKERPGKRPRLNLGLGMGNSKGDGFVDWERARGVPTVIKGFEDEVLVREVRETFRKVGTVVDWTDRIWQDLVESGEIGGAVGGDEETRGEDGPEQA